MATITENKYQFEQQSISSTTTLGEITDIVSLMANDQSARLDIFFWCHYPSTPEDFFNTAFKRVQILIKKTSSGLEIAHERNIYSLYEGETGASVSFGVSITGMSNEVITIECTPVGTDVDAFANINLIYKDS